MNDGNIPEVSEFGSVDPAPPSEEKDVETLKQVLNNETERMFVRISDIKETFVKWDKEKNKCFAGFTVTGSNVGVNETITVSGEVLSFFNTGIDTRVYFIKNF